MSREDDVLNYVQGRMGDAETAQFERDLQADAALRSEVAVLQAARGVLAPEAAPGKEEGWRRLSAALDAEPKTAPLPTPANVNRTIWAPLAQAAGIAGAAIALWQFVAVPNLGLGPDTRFTPASEATSGPVLQIMFQDSATLGDLSEILAEFDGAVVSGPGAMGLYRVAFPTADAREAARRALTGRDDLVADIFVE
jgi:hypothetical protein